MRPLLWAAAAALAAIALIVALAVGLTRDPRLLPTTTLDEPAPEFTLAALDGSRVSLDDLRGRPVVINFWASWCSECKKEHPLLMKAHAEWENRVAFVGVIFQDSPGDARRFLLSRGESADSGYPNLLDPGSRVAIDYGVYGVPETFFIDRDGTIVAKRIGRVSYELLEGQLRRLTAPRAA